MLKVNKLPATKSNQVWELLVTVSSDLIHGKTLGYHLTYHSDAHHLLACTPTESSTSYEPDRRRAYRVDWSLIVAIN
jgi:hypothetical protein